MMKEVLLCFKSDIFISVASSHLERVKSIISKKWISIIMGTQYKTVILKNTEKKKLDVKKSMKS